MRRKLRGDTILAVIGVAVLALFAVLRASSAQQHYSQPSTYDYGGNGLAALYTLLSRERVDVSRFELPLGRIAGRKGAFVVAGDGALLQFALDAKSRNTLDAWVRDGGTLVLAGGRPASAMFGLPKADDAANVNAVSTACAFHARPLHLEGPFSTFHSASACNGERATLLRSPAGAAAVLYHRGRGVVIYLTSQAFLDNGHIARADNAAFAYALFAPLGPVAFDEAVYGYETGKTMWQVLPLAVHYAIFIGMFAMLAGLVGSNIRFAPPVDSTQRHVRDSSEYIQSLAGLLSRGRAQSEVVARFVRAMERFAAGRHAAGKTATSLQQARMLAMSVRTGDDDVLAAAQLYARLRKDD